MGFNLGYIVSRVRLGVRVVLEVSFFLYCVIMWFSGVVVVVVVIVIYCYIDGVLGIGYIVYVYSFVSFG